MTYFETYIFVCVSLNLFNNMKKNTLYLILRKLCERKRINDTFKVYMGEEKCRKLKNNLMIYG